MGRPPKWRKVEFIPQDCYFKPVGKPMRDLDEVILKVEELEALRLKELEGLEQSECAGRMEVSRQTFQRILNIAHEKITDALVNGKAIRIEGGNYTRNICTLKCTNCKYSWQESYEVYSEKTQNHIEITCPQCGAEEIRCLQDNDFCKGHCYRHGRRT